MKTKTTNPSMLQQGLNLFKGLVDKRTPWVPKIIGILILLYIFLPFDFVTDFAPFLGWLDDLTVATVGLFIISKLIPKEVLSGEPPEEKPTGKINN